MKDYKELTVWKTGMEVVSRVYEKLRTYPASEMFALSQQTKRAALSVPANIAEGVGRDSRKETVRFLHIARGSLYELETLLQIGMMTGCLKEDDYKQIESLTGQCGRLLNGFVKYHENAPNKNINTNNSSH